VRAGGSQRTDSMGIAGFSGWFAQMYPSAYVPLQPRSADHLYVDIAGILHTVIRRGEHPPTAKPWHRVAQSPRSGCSQSRA